jgi:hypothetical protein
LIGSVFDEIEERSRRAPLNRHQGLPVGHT